MFHLKKCFYIELEFNLFQAPIFSFLFPSSAKTTLAD